MDGLHLVHNEVNQLICRVTETFVHWSVNEPGVVFQVQDLPSSDKTKEPKKFYCFDLHNSAPSSLPQRAAFFFEVANNTLGRQFRESNDCNEKDVGKKNASPVEVSHFWSGITLQCSQQVYTLLPHLHVLLRKTCKSHCRCLSKQSLKRPRD